MSHSETSPQAVEPQGEAEVTPAAAEALESPANVTPSCACSGNVTASDQKQAAEPSPPPGGQQAIGGFQAVAGFPGTAYASVAPSQEPVVAQQPLLPQAPVAAAMPQTAPTFYMPRLSPALRSRGGFQPSGWQTAPVQPITAWPGAGVFPQQDDAVSEPRSFTCEAGSDLVFALGELGYDFGCEARLDYFVQQMGSMSAAMNPMCMAKYLQKQEKVDALSKKKGGSVPDPCPDLPDDPNGHEEDANALIWTLNIDATPTFAILPDDQFAAKSYDLLTDFLFDQYFDPDDEKPKTRGKGGNKKAAAKPDADNKDAKSEQRLYRVAMAGRIDGTTSLYNGTIVPVIRPVTRGMFNWDADTLLDAILGEKPWADDQKEESAAIQDFLRRIYYELRNLGQTSQERALNFAGTNAYNSGEVFREAWSKGLNGLESFGVEQSPICRPDSDCWDVKMTFFDPENPYERARWVYRYTIDVSDVMPVTVGPVRAWPVYTNPKT